MWQFGKQLYLAQYVFSLRTTAWENESLKAAIAVLMVALPQFWLCGCLVCVLEVVRGSRFLLLKQHAWLFAFVVPVLYEINYIALVKLGRGPRFIAEFDNFSIVHRRILNALVLGIFLATFGLGLIVVPWRDHLVPY